MKIILTGRQRLIDEHNCTQNVPSLRRGVSEARRIFRQSVGRTTPRLRTHRERRARVDQRATAALAAGHQPQGERVCVRVCV